MKEEFEVPFLQGPTIKIEGLTHTEAENFAFWLDEMKDFISESIDRQKYPIAYEDCLAWFAFKRGRESITGA